jgi:hypothetical protein
MIRTSCGLRLQFSIRTNLYLASEKKGCKNDPIANWEGYEGER